MAILHLRNGAILTDNWTTIQPTAQSYKTIQVYPLIRAIQERRADWLKDGLPLDTVHIPVADMFEEFADILVELGLTDAYERIGIPVTRVSIEVGTDG